MIFRVFEWNAGSTIFEMQTIFGIVNTFVFCGMLANLFYLLRGSFPKANKKDALISLTLLAGLMFCSHFDESFIWMAGAVNYGWAIFLASCLALPYRRYWDSIGTKSAAFSDSLKGYFSIKEILKALGFFIISIPVGMGGEIFTPPLCFGLFVLMFIVFFSKKQIPPLWFLAGGLGLFAGWLLLILAPGPAIRKAAITAANPEVFAVSFPIMITRFMERISPVYTLYPLIFLGLYAFWQRLRKHKISLFINVLVACGLFGIIISCVSSYLPSRAAILYNIFFIFASMLVLVDCFDQKQESSIEWNSYLAYFLGLALLKCSPLDPLIRTFLYAVEFPFYIYIAFKAFPIAPYIVKKLAVPACLSLMTFYLITYFSFYSVHKQWFSEIQRQKEAGISRIIIPSEKTAWWCYYLNNLDTSPSNNWVLPSVAAYYNVERIDFVDPITMKSYRKD